MLKLLLFPPENIVNWLVDECTKKDNTDPYDGRAWRSHVTGNEVEDGGRCLANYIPVA